MGEAISRPPTSCPCPCVIATATTLLAVLATTGAEIPPARVPTTCASPPTGSRHSASGASGSLNGPALVVTVECPARSVTIPEEDEVVRVPGG